jgi:hypothetical protein
MMLIIGSTCFGVTLEHPSESLEQALAVDQRHVAVQEVESAGPHNLETVTLTPVGDRAVPIERLKLANTARAPGSDFTARYRSDGDALLRVDVRENDVSTKHSGHLAGDVFAMV